LLNHILDDSLTYQDVTKKVFLEKLNELFNELKERDIHLVSQNGFCNSEECSNKGIKGILFCGNNSGKHFNFILEQNTDGRITDIFHCNKFQCESENAVDENKRELAIKIYEDEKAKFVPTSDYLNKNNYSLSAISELKSTKNREIKKDEIVLWLNKHKEFYDILNWTSYKYKNLSKFYDCYGHLSKINDFFNLEEACFNALQVYLNNDMTIEIQFLKWLVEYEALHYNLILLHPNIISETELKSGEINLFYDLNRYFIKDTLKCCISVEKIYDTFYYDKLNKYKIENNNTKDVSPFDDEFDDYISLGYHLEKRNLFVDKINYIPLLGTNSFLYDAPDFTNMLPGVNLGVNNASKGSSNHKKENDEFEIL